MLVAMLLGLSGGVVIGGAVAFGTISWITNHVASFEKQDGKYYALQTRTLLLAIKVK